VAAEIIGARGTAEAITADLTSPSGADVVAAACCDRWARLDVAFMAQAMLDHEPAATACFGHWERVLRTNLLGPIAYTRALMPLLRASGTGSMIYLGSIDGSYGNPSFPAYSVSKGGLIPLTHVTAHDEAVHGVRVNLIAMAAMLPLGSTDPEPIEVVESARTTLLHATPLARLATPDDVAAAAVFLASTESSYITGVVLPVDGGRTAITPGTSMHAGPTAPETSASCDSG
jgi:NAD(P)-dependent dehydrogenase (short-subunit alcohol dehydrogenase family)